MKKIFTLLFAALPILFTSCDKEPNFGRINALDLSKIGTVGDQDNGKPNVSFATVWSDGLERQMSSEQEHASARSITISDRKIYIAGFERGSTQEKPQAVLWVNYVKQILPSDTLSEAYSVAAHIGTLCVAGVEHRRGGGFTPILWMNGERRVLNSRSGNAVPTSVATTGLDVYVAGYESGYDALPGVDTYAVLWKNGVMTVLDAGSKTAKANSVFVAGNDVYVAGSVSEGTNGERPALWKNGALQLIDAEASAVANAVYAHKGDVYLAGSIRSGSHNMAALWKNGVRKQLPILATGAESVATSLYVDDKEYYVAGYEDDKAIIWLDGIRHILTDNRHKGRAYSICPVR